MIKMVTKQNIIHWHMSGMSQRSIARQAKVSRRTVQKVLRESESIRQKVMTMHQSNRMSYADTQRNTAN